VDVSEIDTLQTKRSHEKLSETIIERSTLFDIRSHIETFRLDPPVDRILDFIGEAIKTSNVSWINVHLM